MSETYGDLLRKLELLRLEHNEMGRKFREGLITSGEWENYQDADFLPRNMAIHAELQKLREIMESTHHFELQDKGDTMIVFPSEAKTDADKIWYLLALRKATADEVGFDRLSSTPIYGDMSDKLGEFTRKIKDEVRDG